MGIGSWGGFNVGPMRVIRGGGRGHYEPEKQPEKPKNKIGPPEIIATVIFVLIMSGFALYYYFNPE